MKYIVKFVLLKEGPSGDCYKQDLERLIQAGYEFVGQMGKFAVFKKPDNKPRYL